MLWVKDLFDTYNNTSKCMYINYIDHIKAIFFKAIDILFVIHPLLSCVDVSICIGLIKTSQADSACTQISPTPGNTFPHLCVDAAWLQ